MNTIIEEILKEHPDEPLFKIIYRYLFNEIIMQNLAPNDVINVSSLAETLNISRTPINNAVSLLVANGFASRDSRGHAVVCAPKAYDMFNVCAARQIIEVQAAVQLCASYKSKLAKKLHEINNEFSNGLRTHDFKKVLENDLKLHRLIVSESPNPLLLVMYDAISADLERYLSYCSYRLTRMDTPKQTIETSINHHNMILVALESKSPVNVETVMNRHLSFGTTRLLPNPKMSLE